MKKLYILLGIVAVISHSSFAQSFQLSTTDTTITNVTDSILFAPTNITNISGNALDVIVERIELNVITGTENVFCWVLCYAPATSISPDAITMNPGETVDKFYAKYYPNGNTGTSNLKYKFYDKNNPNDSVIYTVTYNATPVGLNENKRSNAQFKIQPNPTFSNAILKYTVPFSEKEPTLVITDILGKEIKSIKLNPNENVISLDVSSLNPGIYFYSIKEGEKYSRAQKLVIAR